MGKGAGREDARSGEEERAACLGPVPPPPGCGRESAPRPHLAGSRGGSAPAASSQAQEGGSGGEGVKSEGSEAAARPWAAASAGCFDHGGAVAVSFCSRDSSRAADRPPRGPALPRPPPAVRTREGGRGARPGRLQAPPDAPSPPLPQPPGPRPAVGEGVAGRPQLLPRLALGPGGWARCQGVLGTAAPRGCSPQPTPPGPPTRSLTPRMHTPGRRRCCAPAGGRAERRARTTAAGSRARRRHACAHAGHTRAHRTRTHARPLHARPEHTCAHTHARTQARTGPRAPSAWCSPPRNRWALRGPSVGPGTLPPL